VEKIPAGNKDVPTDSPPTRILVQVQDMGNTIGSGHR
jgi:hypothetical protein